MKSILIITLFVATAIAVPTKSLQSRSGFHESNAVAVDINEGFIQLPPELENYTDGVTPALKDSYGGTYVPLTYVPTEVIPGLRTTLCSNWQYVPTPLSPIGLYLYPVRAVGFDGITHDVYLSTESNVYAKL